MTAHLTPKTSLVLAWMQVLLEVLVLEALAVVVLVVIVLVEAAIT